MKKFFIITNEQKDVNLSMTQSIEDYIQAKGGQSAHYISVKSHWTDQNLKIAGLEHMDADCIIVLGGDGTLVRAARDLGPLGIPVIGVNLGTLGYLCELERSTVFPAIDRLFEDQYEVENRMMIEGIFEENGVEKKTSAMNDIVIHRTGAPQIINLTVSVNGEYLTTYSADGVIISTPTGSTGYSMSAGGPIVAPEAQLILITPINSHTISAKSIVVGPETTVEVMISTRRQEQDETAEVSFDGDSFANMKVGEKIVIRKAPDTVKVLKLSQLSFLQILRKKMQEVR